MPRIASPVDALNLSPAAVFNMPPAQGASPQPPGLARSVGPGLDAMPGPLHPDNPLFWFGVLLAGTLGLIAISTTVRVGPASVSGAIGKK